jgi:arginase
MQTASVDSSGDSATLRLLCPQWQGAGTSSVRDLASEFLFDVARRGYAIGSVVLAAVLPPSDGPTATVPITMGDEGLDLADGVEARAVLLNQLARALIVIEQHTPARIATLA